MCSTRETILDRFCIKQLQNWKNTQNRKPLVLLGARQVGKTHLLEMFGKKHFSDFITVNFEENRDIHSLFENNLDPENIISSLSAYFSITIDPKQTLIIFDEVQECPRALTSLKYFCEKGQQYFVTAAGSLLGLKVSKQNGFPVGKVTLLKLLPMSFFEFLQAMQKTPLLEYLQSTDSITPLPAAIHEQALELFRLYTFIGGMPEAIKVYRDTGDLQAVRVIQAEIVKAYEFDFAKHAQANQIAKLTEIWYSIPQQLAKENKKFVFSAIKPSARAREYEAAIQWLVDAGIVYRCHDISTPKLPLPAYSDKNAFKLYLLDTGLLCAMSNLDSSAVLNTSHLFSEFKGALIENIVAQQLMNSRQEHLYYWTSGNQAEVDFITTVKNNLIPIETKAGTSSKKKSLLVYINKYQPKHAVRTSPMNLKCDGNITNYPLYLLEKFPLTDPA